jgi:hypothetical protein
MELAWWLGESSITEAAGSLAPWEGLVRNLGMAWWAFRNHWRNQPGEGEWSEKELAAGSATG